MMQNSGQRTPMARSGHRKAVCFSMLALMSATSLTAYAERPEGGAPIVFAASAPSRLDAGPLDIRPGAAPVKFTPGSTSLSSGLADTPRQSVSSASRRDGFSEPYAGPPYQVQGKWFVPMHEPDYDEVGIASWYGPGFHGELGASGEEYDQDMVTAAHPTLPIPSVVRVTNLENNRSVLVRVNDRGPYIDDRIIDLSRGAATALDVIRKGTAKVRVEYVGAAPVNPRTQLTETMYGRSGTMQAGYQQPASTIWSTPLPPSQGMPDRPAAQAADEGYARPEESPAAKIPQSVSLGSPAGGYALQVGSFSDLTNAQKARAAYAGSAETYVASAIVNGTQFYRVMVGPWTQEADAKAFQDRLAQSGSKSILVNIAAAK